MAVAGIDVMLYQGSGPQVKVGVKQHSQVCYLPGIQTCCTPVQQVPHVSWLLLHRAQYSAHTSQEPTTISLGMSPSLSITLATTMTTSLLSGDTKMQSTAKPSRNGWDSNGSTSPPSCFILRLSLHHTQVSNQGETCTAVAATTSAGTSSHHRHLSLCPQSSDRLYSSLGSPSWRDRGRQYLPHTLAFPLPCFLLLYSPPWVPVTPCSGQSRRTVVVPPGKCFVLLLHPRW